MARTFIHRLLDALFNRKKDDVTPSGNKTGSKKIKTAKAGSKAEVKEKSDTEIEAEVEEKIRSCALEIKGCIDLINSTGENIPAKSKKRSGRHNIAGKAAGNRKAANKKKTGKEAKKSNKGASPAEMMMLLAKAEEKLSEAVVKAKQDDDKKRDAKTKQR